MSARQMFRARVPVKVRGRWLRPGTDRDRAELTPDEAAPYAHALDPMKTLAEQQAEAKAAGRMKADVDASQEALEAAGIPGAAPQPRTVPDTTTADADASQRALEASGVPGAAPQAPTPDAPEAQNPPGYEARAMKADAPSSGGPSSGPSIAHTGGGWYEVRDGSGAVADKVQGKAEAEAALARLAV